MLVVWAEMPASPWNAFLLKSWEPDFWKWGCLRLTQSISASEDSLWGPCILETHGLQGLSSHFMCVSPCRLDFSPGNLRTSLHWTDHGWHWLFAYEYCLQCQKESSVDKYKNQRLGGIMCKDSLPMGLWAAHRKPCIPVFSSIGGGCHPGDIWRCSAASCSMIQWL